MKISACVIAKDEERNLPRWIASMKRAADELIVVDTGSSDSTPEIARSGGARLFSYEWENDFAAAKNFAIEKASGDWILFFDADEYLEAPDSLKLRELIRRNHREKKVAGFVMRLIDVDTDGKFLPRPSGVHRRVFRNSPLIRFRRPIHEVVENTGSGEFIYERGIEFYHTGYSTSIVTAKLRRNLDILLKKRAAGGEEPEDVYYFADCYYGIEDYEKAADYSKKAIDSDIVMVGRKNVPHMILIQSLINLKRPPKDVYEAIRRAKETFPQAAEFSLIEGLYAWRQRDYLRAEKTILSGIGAEKIEDVFDTTDQSGDFIHGAYACIIDICRRRKDEKSLMGYVANELSRHRRYEPVTDFAIGELSSLTDADMIAALGTWYDDGDSAYLARRLSAAGRGTCALYYERRSRERIFTDYDRYFLAGRYDAAAASLADEICALTAVGLVVEKNPGYSGTGQFLPEGGRSVPPGCIDTLARELAGGRKTT